MRSFVLKRIVSLKASEHNYVIFNIWLWPAFHATRTGKLETGLLKLLMFNVSEFWYNTCRKTINDVDTVEKEETVNDAIVVFANVEKEDEDKSKSILS
jgi:hypothetical protein